MKSNILEFEMESEKKKPVYQTTVLDTIVDTIFGLFGRR
jgi:hypothetical protein